MNMDEIKKEFEERYPTNEEICCCSHEYCDPKRTWDSKRLTDIWNFFEPIIQKEREEAGAEERNRITKILNHNPTCSCEVCFERIKDGNV